MPDDHEKVRRDRLGVFRTSCGSTSRRCSQRVNRTPWGAIGLAWMTARPQHRRRRSCRACVWIKVMTMMREATC